MEVQRHSLLASALGSYRWSASCLDCFNPGGLLSSRLAGPQSQCRRFGEQRNLMFMLKTERKFRVYPALSLLFWTHYPGYGQLSEGRCFDSIQGTEASLFSIRREYKQNLGLIQTPVQWVPDVLSPGRGMKLTIHLHLMPRLIICGATSTIPHTSPFHDV